MKCLAFAFFIIAALLAVAFAGDCEVKNHSFNKGEKYQPPGECTQMTCEGPGLISAKGCPSVASLKPCVFVPMDPSKPFPKCCSTFKC